MSGVIPGLESTRAQRCPDCGAPIRRIHDSPVAGLPLTIDAAPTTRVAALTGVIAGRAAVYARRIRRDRGAGTVTEYRRLDKYTIRDPRLADLEHHTVHVCGIVPPPLPVQGALFPPDPDAVPPF